MSDADMDPFFLDSIMEVDSFLPQPIYLHLSPREKALQFLRGPMLPANVFLNTLEKNITKFVLKNIKSISTTSKVISSFLFLAYFIVACLKDLNRAKDLIYITTFVMLCLLYSVVKNCCGEQIQHICYQPFVTCFTNQKIIFTRLWYSFVIISFAVWIGYDTKDNPRRLVSLAGMLLYILIGYIFSAARDQIKWRPIIWGFVLQFVMGLLIIRTDFGYQFFAWLSNKIALFMNFSVVGQKFLFGDSQALGLKIVALVVFFCSINNIFYYYGIIQVVMTRVAWCLKVILNTSPTESINAAANIFVGMNGAALIIRPFLKDMTTSELHAVMTGGFATISGSLFAIYMSFGIPGSHLLSASVMSAPAALAMAKLMYPETEEVVVTIVTKVENDEPKEQNILEAAAVGAFIAIRITGEIIVMVLVFVSVLAFLNAMLQWLGGLIDVPQLSFEFICSYFFVPFAFAMGVPWKDAKQVGELIAIKTFLNDFIAYQRLSKLIQNRLDNAGTFLTIRSEVITTYALCGFSNFCAIGISLGCLSALAPTKRRILSRIVLRAMISGSMACFTTACIAGLLIDETTYDTVLKPRNSTIIT